MIILDEPTAGVDIDIRSSVWNYIKKINNLGTTICLTTHYLEEAEKLCDYITILNEGRVIASDSKKNLLSLISVKKVSFILKKEQIIPDNIKRFKYNLNENILNIEYDKNITSLNEIIKLLDQEKIEFTEINTYESNLEDTFLKLIKD